MNMEEAEGRKERGGNRGEEEMRFIKWTFQ